MEFSVVKELNQAVFLKSYPAGYTRVYRCSYVETVIVIDGQASLQPTHGV